MNARGTGNDRWPLEVAPGIWRLRTPMAGHPLGDLNSYLLTADDGVILVDTPWGVPATLDALEAGIRETGFSPADVRAVLVTHYHEDHSGGVAWFEERYGSHVIMHVDDAECLRVRQDATEFTMHLAAWLNEIGADADAREDAVEQFRTLAAYAGAQHDLAHLVSADQLLELGGRRIRALHTPGHTPGSLSFFDESSRFLFSGDHVFDRRHSNAVKRPFSPARPISAYWESSQRLLALEPTVVLPGHDGPIVDFESRMRSLARLRDVKLAEAVALARGGTAWELAALVRRSTPWADLSRTARLAAAGELLAYLYEGLDAGLIRAAGRDPIRWDAGSESTPSRGRP